jgi:hypothetical protein
MSSARAASLISAAAPEPSPACSPATASPVTALDPVAASLAVAQTKPGAERVCWVHGYADLPPLHVLVTMTADVAQVFLTDAAWAATLGTADAAPRPGGRLVFETRHPSARDGWRGTASGPTSAPSSLESAPSRRGKTCSTSRVPRCSARPWPSRLTARC